LSIGLAPWLVRSVVAPAADAVVQERAIELMRVMLLSTGIFGVSGIIMGALNAHQHFLLPAIAPILYNLAIIAGTVFGGATGSGTMGAAIGMVVGSAAHLLIQLPGLLRYHARYTPTLGLRDAGVREVGRLMAPRVLGVAAVQINMVVTTRLASSLGVGAISALDYAWHLMLLPQGIFAQAVGTAVFPTFSDQGARGDFAAMQQTLASMLRMLVVLMLPATAGMIVLGRPFIALALERGAFSATSTDDVSVALALFALGLVGHSLIEILARAFYALHDTWTPAVAGIGSMVLNLLLGLSLPLLFTGVGWKAHGGLALANALAALVEMAVLLILMQRRIGVGLTGSLWKQSVRSLVASLGMALLVLLWLRLGPQDLWLQSIGGLVVWGASYVLFAWLLRIDELRTAVQMVLRRR
ncbi:MAG: murein biosynthesis integral membrane protein MurJ, partial [Anaerolineae bacterium]|nr:murein biosynthesis integral membrane protein MurJ [Anaerolineae bacterium]